MRVTPTFQWIMPDLTDIYENLILISLELYELYLWVEYTKIYISKVNWSIILTWLI